VQEPGQKIIDLETAAQMLQIALPGNPHTEPFTSYLQEQTEYKCVTGDQWNSFFRFAHEVRPRCSSVKR
jgi:Cullin binding